MVAVTRGGVDGIPAVPAPVAKWTRTKHGEESKMKLIKEKGRKGERKGKKGEKGRKREEKGAQAFAVMRPAHPPR